MTNISKASSMTIASQVAMPKSSCSTHVPPTTKSTTTAQCASLSSKSATVAFQRASIAQAYPGNGADLNRPGQGQTSGASTSAIPVPAGATP